MSDCLKPVQEYIESLDLFSPKSKILCGVSGGIDSMVMLHILYKLGYNISVAHCNFSLRGEESDNDEKLVEKFAEQLSLNIYKVKFNTLEHVKTTGDSIQMAARKLRYDWFDSLREEYGFDVTAIAHNLNDRSETFFINTVRGTGIRGLASIPVKNGSIVRPVMCLSRDDIKDYASVNGIEYREDSSNLETKYLRNKIRHKVTPLFREMANGFDKIMDENINHVEEAVSFIDEIIDELSMDVKKEYYDHVVLNMDEILKYRNSKFILYELLRAYGFSYDTCSDIIKTRSSGKRFYADKYEVVVNRSQLIVADLGRKNIDYSVKFDHLNISEIDNLNEGLDIVYIDEDKLKGELSVRRWHHGDSFRPLGMRGTKKVSDFLIDNKIPIIEKEKQLVVCEGDSIVWLVGRRIDDRYKIDEKSKRIVKMSYTRF